MPLFPSDFKKFKHVSSDDKTTTLRHDKGHELKIAHSALSPNMRKQLEALRGSEPTKQAEGGIIEEADRSGILGTQRKVDQEIKDKKTKESNYVPNDSKDVRTPEQKERAVEAAKQYGYAEGGPVQPEAVIEQPVARITELDPDIARKRDLYNNLIQSDTVLPPNVLPAPKESRMFGAQGEAPQELEPNAWATAEQMFQREKANNAAEMAQAQQTAIKSNSARVAAGLAPNPVPNVPTGPQVPGSEANPVTAQPPGSPPAASDATALGMASGANPLASGMQDMEGMLKSGYNSRLEGIQQTANAQQQLGEQQAQVLAQTQQAQESAKVAYQQHYDQLEAERQALSHDVQEGYVDPEKFWNGDKNGNGGHSRIAAGIGMILAGFNPTNSPNAAINYLKHQMDLNLDAQKQNLSSKQNLLAANLRQFGNLKDATEFTRIQQNDIMQNQLQQAAAKASSPLAKAAALQAAGQLKMEVAPMFQQFAMRRAMMGLAQNGGDPNSIDHMLGYMRVSNPEMAKEMESRYIPHVGMASIPVPADVREKITAHENMGVMIKDLQNFVNSHSTIVPGTPEYNVGQQKALVLQSAVREGQLGTVYREGEQPLLDKFVNSNPAGALKMLKTVPQLKELLKSNERAGNVLKQNYGLPASKPEPEIKVINGVRYMRGPDGKAVKVK